MQKMKRNTSLINGGNGEDDLCVDEEGYRGVYRTTKTNRKYFIRIGETPKEAYIRQYGEDLTDMHTVDILGYARKRKKGVEYIELPPDKYARLNKGISEQYRRKPMHGIVYLSDYCYVFTYNRKSYQILCTDILDYDRDKERINKLERSIYGTDG